MIGDYRSLGFRVLNRLAALALLGAVLGAAYIFAVEPLRADYVRTKEAIAQAKELMVRYQRIAASREALRERLEELTARQAETGIYLSGDTDALAGAGLQDIVNRSVEAGGGQVRSIQILPVKSDGDFRRVSVRVQMTATIAQVARILHDLEAGQTYLFVDRLEINNRRARRRRKTEVEMDPQLLVRLDLSGYLRPEAG